MHDMFAYDTRVVPTTPGHELRVHFVKNRAVSCGGVVLRHHKINEGPIGEGIEIPREALGALAAIIGEACSYAIASYRSDADAGLKAA